VILAGLPLVVVVVFKVVIFVWMVLDVASRIVSIVGVFIVVFGGAQVARLEKSSPRTNLVSS
jgi:hypothetical protein